MKYRPPIDGSGSHCATDGQGNFVRRPLTELDRLKRRRDSWLAAKGPRWIMSGRQRIIAELNAQIERLEKEPGP